MSAANRAISAMAPAVYARPSLRSARRPRAATGPGVRRGLGDRHPPVGERRSTPGDRLGLRNRAATGQASRWTTAVQPSLPRLIR